MARWVSHGALRQRMMAADGVALTERGTTDLYHMRTVPILALRLNPHVERLYAKRHDAALETFAIPYE